MSLKQRFIYKASIGFALGVFVTIMFYLIHLLSGGYSENIVAKDFLSELVIQLFSGGMMGVIGNGGSVIYEIDHWSIIRTTVTHFCLAFFTFLVLGLLNGWLEPGLTLFNIIMILSWITVYFMIWMIQYLIYKKEVDQINRGVKLLKESKEAS
ncbi:MAG: DUF3021 domain-containing protein [Lachnospiraceae bacterium]|nr:DUF3021 domain-containing protein [Lachnospiraceae bacterium]